MGLEKINELKKAKYMTNAQLAEASGLTISTLDKITAGINKNPKLETIRAICKALDCTLDDLDDSPRPEKLTSSERAHIQKYRQLNPEGQRRSDENLEDLLGNPKYKLGDISEINSKQEKPEILIAAHDGMGFEPIKDEEQAKLASDLIDEKPRSKYKLP